MIKHNGVGRGQMRQRSKTYIKRDNRPNGLVITPIEQTQEASVAPDAPIEQTQEASVAPDSPIEQTQEASVQEKPDSPIEEEPKESVYIHCEACNRDITKAQWKRHENSTAHKKSTPAEL